MKFEQEAFGERVRSLRNERGLTILELAEALNLSEVHMRNLERGRKCCSIDLLLDISDFFGVTTDYLLKGGEKETVKQQMIQEMERLAALIHRL